MNPIIVIINLRLNKKVVCSAINMILHKVRAMAVGNKQYPKTQILWKKDLQHIKIGFKHNEMHDRSICSSLQYSRHFKLKISNSFKYIGTQNR